MSGVNEKAASGGNGHGSFEVIETKNLYHGAEHGASILSGCAQGLIEEAAMKRDDLIKDILQARVNALLIAETKAGKSFVALNMAYSVASGKLFMGRFEIMRRGPAIFLAFEDYEGLAIRECAADRQFNARDLPYYRINCGGALLHRDGDKIARSIEAAMAELVRLGRARKGERPALIVTDTLAKATMGLNENDSKDMGGAIAVIMNLGKRFDCTTLTACHPSRGGRHADKLEPSGYTGLINNFDIALQIKGDLRGRERVLGFSKFKNNDDNLTIPFKLALSGNSLIVEPNGDPKGQLISFAEEKAERMKEAPKAPAATKEGPKLEARIYALLKRRPGLSITKVAQTLKANRSTVGRKMASMGNLRQDESGHYFIRERAKKTA